MQPYSLLLGIWKTMVLNYNTVFQPKDTAGCLTAFQLDFPKGTVWSRSANGVGPDWTVRLRGLCFPDARSDWGVADGSRVSPGPARRWCCWRKRWGEVFCACLTPGSLSSEDPGGKGIDVDNYGVLASLCPWYRQCGAALWCAVSGFPVPFIEGTVLSPVYVLGSCLVN